MSILIKLLTGSSKCISCNSRYCHCLLAVFKHDFDLTLLFLKFAEVSDHFSHSQPPITGTTKAPGTSTALPESTRPALAEDHGDSNRWSLCTLLIFVVALWSNCSRVWNMNSFFHFCALLLFRVSWSFSLPLAVIVAITVMMFISSVIGVVCCRVRTKSKQLGKQFPENCCRKAQTVCQSLW